MPSPMPTATPTRKQGVGGVHQLHAHALQSLLCGLNVQHVQDHGLIGAQGRAPGNHGSQGITDLACGGGGGEGTRA